MHGKQAIEEEEGQAIAIQDVLKNVKELTSDWVLI